MKKPSEPEMLTPAQALLRIHLKELGVETTPEYRFCPDRKFRFDLYSYKFRMGFEVNGHFQGKHGRGWSGDAEKLNLAQMMGYRVMVFTNKQVEQGWAKKWLAEWLER